MSYRLITKATLLITPKDGAPISREVQVRAYPSPKRDASGKVDVDGVSTDFKRTGGKGRGTADNRYMYATVKGESAFWAITEAEAAALIGGQVKLTSLAAEQPKPAEPAKAEPAKAEPAKAPVPTLTKAQRRAAAKATA